MNAAKIAKEIQKLKEAVRSSQSKDFIIIYDESEKAQYTEDQLKYAHVIEIVAAED